jgi:hypothetical protein
VPIESLTKSTTYRQPALPPFWKRALCDFRELKIVRLHPRIFETAEEALALPLWDNPLFPIKQRRFIHSWREALGIWRIRDTINKSRNTILDCDDMIELLTDRFRRAGANAVYASAGKAIPLNTLIRQWDSITSNIPSHISLVARRITTPKYLVYGIGARMLRMAGWREGESLGTRGGVVEPVETPPANKFNRGLGFLAADVHSTSLSHRDDFRATRWEGEVIYGTFDAVTSRFTKYALSVRGAPTTPLASYMVPPAHVTGVVWWGDGICGPAPITFPYPTGWVVAGPDCTLDEVTVKYLTRAFLLPKLAVPSCKLAWEKRLGVVDWLEVGSKYMELLLTPKDFMAHFKCILHRAFLTRKRNKARVAAGDTMCRLCGGTTESISHLPHCPILTPLFNKLARLHFSSLPVGVDWHRFALLGLSSPPLPRAISDLHLVLWKFILIHLTHRDLFNTPFDPNKTWRGAVRRYVSKANSLTHKSKLLNSRQESRGLPHNLETLDSLISPLGELDVSGAVVWRHDFLQHVADAG